MEKLTKLEAGIVITFVNQARETFYEIADDEMKKHGEIDPKTKDYIDTFDSIIRKIKPLQWGVVK